MNTTSLKEKPAVAGWMINHSLNELFSLLTWEPENISEQQFLAFSESSTFAGYLILRIVEAIPNISEILYDILAENLKAPTSAKEEMRINKLFLDMSMEFELFIGIKFASNGFFDIATDNEEHPNVVVIVPRYTEENIDNILQLRLTDANSEWHGTFRKILVPYGTSSVYDFAGVVYHFQRSQINDNFDVFKDSWLRTFGEQTNMKPNDFQGFWDWLKWVVSPNGFTLDDTHNATHFDGFSSFGLTRELVFELLNQILVCPTSQFDLISNRNLTKRDPHMIVLSKLARISTAFKLDCSHGGIFFVSCREWFPNTIMPSLVNFTRALNIAGTLFEKY